MTVDLSRFLVEEPEVAQEKAPTDQVDLSRFLVGEEKEPEGIMDSIISMMKSTGQEAEQRVRSEVIVPFLKGLGAAGTAVFGEEIGATPEQKLEQLVFGQTRQDIALEDLAELLGPSEGVTGDIIQGATQRAFQLGSFPGISPLAGALGGGAGQVTEELGGGPLSQIGAEITGASLPALLESLGQRAASKVENIAEASKRLGLTEAELAPLAVEESRQAFLSKFASKGPRVQNRLRSTSEAISRSFNTIVESESAKIPVAQDVGSKALQDMTLIIKDKFGKQLRDIVAEDFGRLASEPLTSESMVQFWQRINSNMGIDRKKLGLLKGPISEAMEATSPELFKDFKLANELFAKQQNVIELLQPGIIDKASAYAQATGLVGGILTGNVPAITTVIGTQAGKELAAEILTNPNFQGLASKLANTIAKGKFTAAVSINKRLSKEVEKTDPEAAKLLNALTADDFKAAFVAD